MGWRSTKETKRRVVVQFDLRRPYLETGGRRVDETESYVPDHEC